LTKRESRRKYMALDLPTAIDAEKFSASLANFVLELSVPKAAAPKSIEVKAA
jgi:HSP20 family molecular chaperone IbpA